LLHAFFRGQVGGDGVTAAKCAELISRLQAGFGISGADVNGSARLDIGLGDHFADTASAAGHQCGAALQGKVGVHGES
jgi:hypothetical protein